MVSSLILWRNNERARVTFLWCKVECFDEVKPSVHHERSFFDDKGRSKTANAITHRMFFLFFFDVSFFSHCFPFVSKNWRCIMANRQREVGGFTARHFSQRRTLLPQLLHDTRITTTWLVTVTVIWTSQRGMSLSSQLHGNDLTQQILHCHQSRPPLPSPPMLVGLA